MESKDKSYYLNGIKPNNNFSREILRNAVGGKAADKIKKSFTMSKVPRAQTNANMRKARRGKTLESIPKVMSFNILDVKGTAAIEETKEEDEEEDMSIEQYMVKDSESDTDSEDDGGDGNANMTLGATKTEFIQKDPQQLIDSELTQLLKICSEFPEPTEAQLKEKELEFGEKLRHKTLILDMDETLIHAEIKPKSAPPIKDADFTITLKNATADGEEEVFIVYVKIRPFYDECMENLANYYEIVVFTAAEQEYADAILDVLDTENLINHRLYRQH
jgi:TFIIF-interacting CTD phosphatase-like protein